MDIKIHKKKSKKEHKTEKSDAIVFWLSAGIIVSFLLFVFCVIIYIINSNRIISVVQTCITDSPQVSETTLDAFSELQAFYKDSSNFNVVSLLYVLISSILMGTLGLYVQRQKERLDAFEQKKELFEKDIQKYTNRLNNLKSSISINKKSLNELKIQMINSEEKQTYLSITQSLSIALNFATSINSICSHQIVNQEFLSEYTTRFRDAICEVLKYQEVEFEKISIENTLFIGKQIGSIVDLLNFATLKSNGAFSKETHEEFLSYCKSISKKLKKITKTDILIEKSYF